MAVLVYSRTRCLGVVLILSCNSAKFCKACRIKRRQDAVNRKHLRETERERKKEEFFAQPPKCTVRDCNRKAVNMHGYCAECYSADSMYVLRDCRSCGVRHTGSCRSLAAYLAPASASKASAKPAVSASKAVSKVVGSAQKPVVIAPKVGAAKVKATASAAA